MEPRVSREELVRHAGFVRRVAFRLVRDPHTGDDIVQSTLTTALSKPPRRGNLRAWLATVARNFARMELRAASRRRMRETIAARPESTVSTAETIEGLDLQRAIVDAIRGLHEPLRSTLVARYYKDLSAKQIACQQGVSARQVRRRIDEALAILRRRLDKNHGPRSMWMAILLSFTGAIPHTKPSPSSHSPWVVEVAALLTLSAVFAMNSLPSSETSPKTLPDDRNSAPTNRDPIPITLDASDTWPGGVPRSYEIRQGDTLIRLVERWKLSSLFVAEIVQANRRDDWTRLRPGDRLQIPDPSRYRRRELRMPVDDGVRTYEIQTGDTLESIARTHLGSKNRWPEILRLNTGLKPKRLKPGHVIRIPAK